LQKIENTGYFKDLRLMQCDSQLPLEDTIRAVQFATPMAPRENITRQYIVIEYFSMADGAFFFAEGCIPMEID